MKMLPINAEVHEIKAVLVEWTELMAQEKYTEALELIPYDEFHYYEENEWTPELLEAVVNGYGIVFSTKEELIEDFGCINKITSLNAMPDRDEIIESIEIEHDLKWLRENDLAEIWYDVPLNGKQSDLTGRFIIRKIDEQHITLIFEDLHVM